MVVLGSQPKEVTTYLIEIMIAAASFATLKYVFLFKGAENRSLKMTKECKYFFMGCFCFIVLAIWARATYFYDNITVFVQGGEGEVELTELTMAIP